MKIKGESKNNMISNQINSNDKSIKKKEENLIDLVNQNQKKKNFDLENFSSTSKFILQSLCQKNEFFDYTSQVFYGMKNYFFESKIQKTSNSSVESENHNLLLDHHFEKTHFFPTHIYLDNKIYNF